MRKGKESDGSTDASSDLDESSENSSHADYPSSGGGVKRRSSSATARPANKQPVVKVKGGWTPDEDALLVRLVRKHGDSNWSVVARALNERFEVDRRIGKQCRERWNNHLQPGIARHRDWTVEEEVSLVEAHKRYGNRWVAISKHLPGRSENDVKNRFFATKRRKCGAKGGRGKPSPLRDYIVALSTVNGQPLGPPSAPTSEPARPDISDATYAALQQTFLRSQTPTQNGVAALHSTLARHAFAAGLGLPSLEAAAAAAADPAVLASQAAAGSEVHHLLRRSGLLAPAPALAHPPTHYVQPQAPCPAPAACGFDPRLLANLIQQPAAPSPPPAAPGAVSTAFAATDTATLLAGLEEQLAAYAPLAREEHLNALAQHAGLIGAAAAAPAVGNVDVNHAALLASVANLSANTPGVFNSTLSDAVLVPRGHR